jgi:bifunctional non-homologous end joining protein LigD
VPADPPQFIEPCLAILCAEAPEGGEWLHEMKFDGYRTQAHKRNDTQTIYTRRGYDWTARFQSIAESIAELPAETAVVDGEVIVPDSRGASDYHALQLDLAQRRSDRLVYLAFDLLYLDGYDLRKLPLVERKQMLTRLLRDAPTNLRFSEHFDAEGAEVFSRVCDLKLEGIVSKRRDSPYRSGRSDVWLKTKCIKSETYPIIAFVEKLGAQPRRIASLYVGRREGDRLLYAGKVRSGYSDRTAREVRELLDPYVRKTSPLSLPIKKPKATWVEPVIDAEVEFSSVTEQGILREAVFKGIRDVADESPPASAARGTKRKRHGRVPAENILQLLPNAVAPTVDELREYWRRVAPQALEHLAFRPLKLVRNVEGTIFYHKGKLPPVPPSVKRLKIKKREGGQGTRLFVEDVAGLLGLVEIGAVELHPWNAYVDDIEHADVLVFDLDPGEGAEYSFVTQAALALREMLEAEGLESWPKLSGGKGIHVMAPLTTRISHDAAHVYTRKLARRLAATNPERYTISASLSQRAGRLFLDHLRNGRGTTAVGAYSPRARPSIPLAMPVSWTDIERGIAPDAFHLREVLDDREIPKSSGRRRKPSYQAKS